MIKLAVFDFDGTIAKHGKVPQSVLKGFISLHEKGCVTTISTGRGYARVREVLGDDFKTIVSKDALLILEHGTRITDYDGNDIFMADFDTDEIDHVTDFIRANIDIIHLAWFNPKPSSKPQVWVVQSEDLEKEKENRDHYAEVFTGSVTEFRNKLLEQPVSCVSARLKEHVGVENLKLHFTRTNIDVIFQDSNLEFIKNDINKALAVRYILHHLGISSDELLVAGNAINDVEMLDTEAALHILVGGSESDAVLKYLSDPSHITRIESPEKLGTYLKTLS